MRSIVILTGLVMLSGFASAQTPRAAAPPRFPRALAPAMQPTAQYPDGVLGVFDRTYSTVRGYRPLKLDLFYVPSAQAPRPAVVWIHGGGWMGGDPLSGTVDTGPRDELLARMAARGYVTVALTYRFSGEARFPAAVNDVKAAVRWLRANAATYHIDPNRIALWGASSGGYLATFVGVTCGVQEFEGQGGNSTQSSCVQAVIDWFGVLEFKPLLNSGGIAVAMVQNFLGCPSTQCPEDLLQRSDPFTYIKAGDPPFLIMHGDADTLIPIQESRDLLAALRAQGVSARMETVHGANHEWAGADKAQVSAIYAKVQEFLDKTFGVKAHND